MKSFRNLSIKHKLTLVIISSSLLALTLASVGTSVYERASDRSALIDELSALAGTLGTNTAASLTFSDRKSATEMLAALRAERHILAACLYDGRGNPFAEYRRSDAGPAFRMPAHQEERAEFGNNSLTLYRNVSLAGERVGSIAIVSDLGVLQLKVREYTAIAILVLLISVLVTFFLCAPLLRRMIEPILQLAEVAEKVSHQEDYSLRAAAQCSDEVGTLIDSFNQMLERIQERDRELQDAREKLELRVEQRTMELKKEVIERQQAETEMRRARDVAEDASRAKSEFLANMSHEIRTPLNGIMGMTDLALDTELSLEQREYLQTVKSSSDSLLTVINDILDFSKIEAGRVDLENIDFDLRDCVDGTLKTLALQADEKGLELLCDIAAEVPQVVRGDSGRLRQVILNLVGNSIKFTDRGEIAIKVEAGEEAMLQFTVSDTGIGIPEAKQTAIFDPFSQADTSTTRKYGGTGLGLTISSRLVGMMGGKIWLESELGKGARFHFTVRMIAVDSRLADAGSMDVAAALRGVKVLIVDDNRTNRRILEGMLKRWEMLPAMAESGDAALAELLAASRARTPFDLILTDMHMPYMDGFTLIERIRAVPELSAAVIMMLSSAGHRGDAARCRELGLTAYLLKPVRQSDLREALARVMGAREQQRAIPLVTRLAVQDRREGAAYLRILLAEDNPVNQRLAARLLEKRGHRVTVAGNGKEALAALDKESFDLVLMDVQMPEIDGLEATAVIRQRETGTLFRQPIIALTAHAMKGDRELCLAAGMDGYLTKPLNQQELDAMLDQYRTGPPTAPPEAAECYKEVS